MKLTEEQQRAVELRNKNLLVSAAAGSGKTRVLVNRIIHMITDENNPVDIDQLLVVTFTKAAAGEMKDRILAAIEEKLVDQPENFNLQRQQTLLQNAHISTIHSFCLYVIRNYFHQIDLEPDFRMGDQGELKLLKRDVLEEVLEEYYEKKDQDFLDLSETIATGKNDDKLKETILSLYEFSISDPWPQKWLEESLAPYKVEDTKEFEKTNHAVALKLYLNSVIRQWIKDYSYMILLSEEFDGPGMYTETLKQEQSMIKNFQESLMSKGCVEEDGVESVSSITLGDYYEGISNLTFGKLAAARKFQGDVGKKDYIKNARDSIKKEVQTILNQFFFQSPQEMVKNLKKNSNLMETLVKVTIRYMEALEKRKLEQNILDFSDLEHFALRILVKKNTEEPTKTAEFLRSQFKEIMIDEYQDSNFVQELILKVISTGRNRFMVGDVKQSIYRFRMAKPELFMEKYETYEKESENEKIELHRNFRSTSQVIKTVNDVFYGIMGKDLGNVEYDQEAALVAGRELKEIPNKDKLFQTEILLADPKDFTQFEEGEDLEAAMIAKKITMLCESQLVSTMEKDKKTGKEIETLRPVRYSDIVILLRGISGRGGVMAETLKSYGIPAVVTTDTGYFSAIEVQTMLNFLRLVDNPRQDIPMAGVLQSVIGGLTAEELAKIRIEFPNVPFYQGVFSYEKEGKEDSVKGKISRFLQILKGYRERAYDTPVHELLYRMMEETGYLDYVHALPAGQIRRANLEMLYEKAIAYEKTSYHGLFHFVRYMDQLKKYEVDFGEAEIENGEDVVRIMTIHKSKGLEFPVVFVSGMGNGLNQQDIRQRMVLHSKYGIGLDFLNLEKRTRTPSILRQILTKQIQIENMGEEQRILYVALTRAKEKLILTGILKNLDKKLSSYEFYDTGEDKHMSFTQRLKARCYWDWVLPVLMKEHYPITLIGKNFFEKQEMEIEIQQEFHKKKLLEMMENISEEYQEEIEQRLSYRYAYEKEQDLKIKFSVSEMKHRFMEFMYSQEEIPHDMSGLEEFVKMMEFHQPAVEEIVVEEETTKEMEKDSETKEHTPMVELIPYIPDFMMTEHKVNQGLLRGTAMHRMMQCLDFSRNISELEQQIEELREKGLLEEELYPLTSPSKIRKFLSTELGQRMKIADQNGKLYREKPFIMGKEEFYGENGPLIMIQGIIDAFFEEDGNLILVDYKTDFVKTEEELLERYRIQMELYGQALEKATGKKVTEKIIYSFYLDREISIPDGITVEGSTSSFVEIKK